MSEQYRTPRKATTWYNPVSLARSLWVRPKLIAAILSAVVALLLLPADAAGSLRAAIAWNVGAAVYLVAAFWIMSTRDYAVIRNRAEIEDEGRFAILVVILLAIASSFTALFDVIADAKTASGSAKAFRLALAGVTILSSWIVMQVVFTLHYAHDYYGPDTGDGGLAHGMTFPGDKQPDYWDFFYFTTSIGAASQTSDVAITSKQVRRLVAAHAVLSFVFNTTILALAINLAAGLI